MRKFIIIDSLALIHRAFHALPPLIDKKGQLVNALYGFTSVLLKILKDLKPNYIVAAFDLAAPTFRDKIYKKYKSHRPKTPDALIKQIPLVKEMLEAFNIKILEKEGYEADDIIGSLSKWLEENQSDIECIIVTGDLDTLQLVSDKTKVYTLKKGISEIAIYGIKEVKDRFNLEPRDLPNYKALIGDASDNIPGVKGIGQKTAQKLIGTFKDLENLYKNLNSPKISKKVKLLLQRQKDEAFFSRELSTIFRDIPIENKIEDFILGNFDKKKILDKIQQFGFKSLLSRLPFDTSDLNSNGEILLQSTSIRKIKINQNPSEAQLRKFLEQTIDKEFFGTVDQEQFIIANKKEALAINIDKLANTEIKTLMIGYDIKEIYKKFPLLLNKIKNIFDLKIAFWLLDPDRKNFSFEKLCQKYKIAQAQEEKKIAIEEKIVLAFKLKKILWDNLLQNNLLNVYQNIESPLIPVLACMEIQGIKINKKKLNKLSDELNDKINTISKEIYSLAGTKFNINSPKQLRSILFEKLNLPSDSIIKTPKGVISTDESELKKLLNTHPIIEKIVLFRELSKLKNTYVDALPLYADKNSRIHTHFDQTGTATGRLSSYEPNLQSIPIRTDWGKKVRDAFEAEDGYKFVSFDFSQIELRLMAHFSNDKYLIEAFNKDKDIHTITASKAFGIKEEQVNPEQRKQAKTLNFGIMYGLSAFGLSQATGMTQSEAKNFIKNYFAQFSGVKIYIEKAEKEALKKGYVETLFGRKRFLPALQAGGFRARLQAQREAVNTPLQGSVADFMKVSMIKIFDLMKNYPPGSCYLLLQIHDDLLFEIKEDFLNDIVPKIKNIMEHVYQLAVPLKVDVKIGSSWGDLKEILSKKI